MSADLIDLTAADDAASEEFTPERIANLTDDLANRIHRMIRNVERITEQSHILSLNARVESARAGEAGAGFGVVANEVGALNRQIADLVKSMDRESSYDIQEITRINRQIGTNFRGVRLSDLALTNIDLIDRNLYERSCDVRWWATDSSVVDALTENTEAAREHASQRLSVILDSYTVYFDLVLADPNGTIVANGRPWNYASIGRSVADEQWFRDAVKCATGNDYTWQSVHQSDLVNNEYVLTYATAVREAGARDGRVIGALGILFRYEDLAQTIVKNVPLSAEEAARSRVCIIDDQRRVLADSEDRILTDVIEFPGIDGLLNSRKGFILTSYNNSDCCIAHATAPGYETYSTGWHSLMIQKLSGQRTSA